MSGVLKNTFINVHKNIRLMGPVIWEISCGHTHIHTYMTKRMISSRLRPGGHKDFIIINYTSGAAFYSESQNKNLHFGDISL